MACILIIHLQKKNLLFIISYYFGVIFLFLIKWAKTLKSIFFKILEPNKKPVAKKTVQTLWDIDEDAKYRRRRESPKY